MAGEMSELVGRLRESHATTRDLIEGVDPELPIHLDSGWTVRDVLGHIGSWDAQAAKSLRAFSRAEEYSLAEGEESFNQGEYGRLRDLSTTDALAEWQSSRAAFISALEDVSTDGEMMYPWGERGSVADLVDEMIDHDAEHRDELLAVIGRSD